MLAEITFPISTIILKLGGVVDKNVDNVNYHHVTHCIVCFDI